MGAHPVNPGIKLGSAAHQDFQAHGSGQVGHLRQHHRIVKRQGTDSRHDLGTVYQGKPLPGFQLNRF